MPDLPKFLTQNLGNRGKHEDADWREHAPAQTLVRRKRTGADELLDQIDHFRLAGDLSDRLFVIFVYCRAASPKGRPSATGAKVLA